MTFKLFDTRSNMALQTNRKHEAGVTFVHEVNEDLVLTGSYDTTIRLWDRRKLIKEVEVLNTEH